MSNKKFELRRNQIVQFRSRFFFSSLIMNRLRSHWEIGPGSVPRTEPDRRSRNGCYSMKENTKFENKSINSPINIRILMVGELQKMISKAIYTAIFIMLYSDSWYSIDCWIRGPRIVVVQACPLNDWGWERLVLENSTMRTGRCWLNRKFYQSL